MAHEVESMVFTGQVPWHGLGRFIKEENMSIENAIVAAGLNWNVKLVPLFAEVDQGRLDPVQNRALMRDSDKSILGVVGPSYTPLQNLEAFKFFQPFLDAKECTIETAGSLREGKRVWVLAKLNRDPMTIVKGDDVLKYLLISNSHDGLLAVRVGYTPIRVVCANTLKASLTHKDSQLIRIKHHSKVVQNLEDVRNIMNAADATFEATAEQYRLLAASQINAEDLEKYVRQVFKLRVPKQIIKGVDELEVARKQKTLDKVVNLFENGRGNQLPGVKGTYWAAYNSVTEYLSYEKGRSADVRLDNLWFGSGSQLNSDALAIAMQMAG